MSQFMDVIEFLDNTGEELVHRVPPEGSGETKLGARCIVRDSQAAVFFKDGKGTDILGPGRHALSTQNIPVLTKLLMLPWGFDSFFKAEVYFVNQKVFIGLKWGTRDPVAFKDSQLGMVRLRAYGVYSIKVTQPLLFINTLVGTQGVYTTDAIKEYLRDVIVSRLNDFLGEHLDTLIDLPKEYDEVAQAVKARLGGDFDQYGMELRDFYINSITPPEEVQKLIDERSGMAAVGDMDRYLKFKAALAIGDAAKNPGGGGMAAAGLGMGAGAGIGMMLPGMILKTTTPKCPKCGAGLPAEAEFCPHCGEKIP